METKSKKLLKKGIISLLPENNDIFKQNIIDALVFKIHENVDITKKLIGKNLLFRETPTPQSPELLEISILHLYSFQTFLFRIEKIRSQILYNNK